MRVANILFEEKAKCETRFTEFIRASIDGLKGGDGLDVIYSGKGKGKASFMAYLNIQEKNERQRR